MYDTKIGEKREKIMKKIIAKIKNIKTEDLLCAFVILCPLLDILSFIYRNTFDTTISPSTFLRPIIPIALILLVFFKNNIKSKILIGTLIYGIYAVIHLYIFEKIRVGASYGGVLQEAQYMANYTFMILNLFLFVYLFWKKDCDKLKKSILITFTIYIVLIYLSIITQTSSTTYIEGTGYKGWFESGNSLCSILCISLCILLPMLRYKKLMPFILTLILLSGIFLTMLVGTRTGILGFGLVLILYIFSECFVAIKKKDKLNKQTIVISAIVIALMCILALVLGSKSFQRREELKEIQVSTIDVDTGKETHVSGDLLNIKKQIDKGIITEEYLSKPMQKAITRLYDYAESSNISNNDMRRQQFVYNMYLAQEQKSIPLMLFGNGYKAQFRELVLEMEVPAFIFNFGLIGFAIYFVPFLSITLYGVYYALRDLSKIDGEYIMYMGGSTLAIALSLLSGYTFFNSSSMVIVIVVNVLLLNKIKEEK